MCGKAKVYNYEVQVTNYIECGNITRNKYNTSDLEQIWNSGGFGINIEICGYASAAKVLIKIKHFAYIGISRYPLNDVSDQQAMMFKPSGDMDTPLLYHLWEATVCINNTREVVLQFYKELSNRKRKQLADVRGKGKVQI